MIEKIRSLSRLSEDVLNLELRGSKSLFTHPTHRVKDFIDKIKLACQHSIHENEREKLFGEGIDCQLLQLGSSSWRKGRIRVCIQFIPESEESIEPKNSIEFPLDEIRQTLNDVNSIDA